MRIIILFLLTLVLMLALKLFVAPRYGEDVEGRFLERLKYIPSQTELSSSATLSRWLANKANSEAIRGYVYPVLFPLDILFLLSLGLLLGFASGALGSRLEFLSNVPAWIWWVFPFLYMASDLAEDMAIAAIFKAIIPLTDGSYNVLSALTAVKIATVGIAIGQVGFLAALNALMFFFPAPRPL